MSWLVDTNVVSEVLRLRPATGALAWIQAQERLHVSAVTVDEIEFGLAWRPKPRAHGWWRDFLVERCVVHPVEPW